MRMRPLRDEFVNFGIAEKLGDCDQQIFEQVQDLRPILAQQLQIVGKFFDPMELHPPANPAHDRRAFVLVEVVAGACAHLSEDLLKDAFLIVEVPSFALEFLHLWVRLADGDQV